MSTRIGQLKRHHRLPRPTKPVVAGIVAALTIPGLIVAAVLLMKPRPTTNNLHGMQLDPVVQSRVTDQPVPDWKVLKSKVSPKSSLKQIQMLGEKIGWMFAYPTELFRTLDGGENWQHASLGLPQDAYLTDIYFITADFGFITASRTKVDFNVVKGEGSYNDATWIMQTNDGGKTWADKLSIKAAQIVQISFTTDREGWAVGRKFSTDAGTRDTNLLLHTRDGGSSWVDLSDKLADPSPGVSELFALNSASAWLVTLNGLFYSTTNSGQMWKKDDVFLDEAEQTAIRRVGITDSQTRWLLEGTSGLEGTWSVIAKRKNNQSWVRNQVNGIDLSDALFLSEDHILACGSTSQAESSATREAVILYSTDGGTNWLVVYRDHRSSSLNALAAVSPKQIFAVGEGGLVIKIAIP